MPDRLKNSAAQHRRRENREKLDCIVHNITFVCVCVISENFILHVFFMPYSFDMVLATGFWTYVVITCGWPRQKQLAKAQIAAMHLGN